MKSVLRPATLCIAASTAAYLIANGCSGETLREFDGGFFTEDVSLPRLDSGAIGSEDAGTSGTLDAGRTEEPDTLASGPVALDGTFTTTEDSALSGVLQAALTNGQPPAFSLLSQGAFGTVVLSDPQTGAFTYTPDANAFGVDSFSFRVFDGTTYSAAGEAMVVVEPVQDPPEAIARRISVGEGGFVDVELEGQDPDGDNLTFVVQSTPEYGTFIGNGASWRYTPDLGFSGVDTATFTVDDGTTSSAPATLYFDVSDSPHPPVSSDVLLTTDEDVPVAGTLTGADVDGDPLTWSLVSPPSMGFVSLDPATGEFTYSPRPDVSGSDTFGVRAFDGALHSAPSTVHVSVEPVNDPPRVTDLVVTTLRNEPAELHLLAHDPEEEPLDWRWTSTPERGTVTGLLPAVVYHPARDAVGVEVLEFTVEDASGSTALGTLTINVLDEVSPTADTDGDGLYDVDETLRYSTNPYLADTDGDGFSDFDEVITYAFDADVVNDRFNPRIADIPEIEIEITTQPIIGVTYVETDGTETTISTERSRSSASSVSENTSHANSSAITSGWERGITVEVSAEASATPSTSVSSSVSYTESYSQTREHSTSWGSETAEENTEALAESDGFAEDHSISTESGYVAVNVEVHNSGNVPYTLENLYLNATYFNRTAELSHTPIGNMNYFGLSFPEFTLAPGQSSGTLAFQTEDLDIETVHTLLADSQGITVSPSIYDMLDQDGRSYNFASTGVGTLDATVIVDWAGIDRRETLSEFVAVHSDPESTASMLDVLEDILQLSLETDEEGLVAVEGVANDELGTWMVVHGQGRGTGGTYTTIYTTPENAATWVANGGTTTSRSEVVTSYDLASISVNGGDVVHLLYFLDSDQDGVSDIEEFYYRSDPRRRDTDADGLTDADEIYGWDVSFENRDMVPEVLHVYSDPTRADTDEDGLDDATEANLDAPAEERRNPATNDTDEDGIVDATDDFDGLGSLAANEFDGLDLALARIELVNTTPPYDVELALDLPDALTDIGQPGAGFSTYKVAVYRLLSTTGDFPRPAFELPDGATPLVGDTIPCEDSECRWDLIDILDADASDAGTEWVLTQTGLLGGGEPEHVQYIVYAYIDSHWLPMEAQPQISAVTEEIIITMQPGRIENAELLVGPSHNASRRRLFSEPGMHDERIFYDYDAHISNNWPSPTTDTSADPAVDPDAGCARLTSPGCGRFFTAYDAWDLAPNITGPRGEADHGWPQDDLMPTPVNTAYARIASGQRLYFKDSMVDGTTPLYQIRDAGSERWWVPPISYPYSTGDGVLTLAWNLHLGGNKFKPANSFREIQGSARETLADNFDDATYPDDYVPLRLDGRDFFVDETSNTGELGTWSIRLPAQEDCFTMIVPIWRRDSHEGVTRGSMKDDTVDLCRDSSPPGFGIWTATSRATGRVFGSTRPGNTNAIEVETHVAWHDVPPIPENASWTDSSVELYATTYAFDIFASFEITVLP